MKGMTVIGILGTLFVTFGAQAHAVPEAHWLTCYYFDQAPVSAKGTGGAPGNVSTLSFYLNRTQDLSRPVGAATLVYTAGPDQISLELRDAPAVSVPVNALLDNVQYPLGLTITRAPDTQAGTSAVDNYETAGCRLSVDNPNKINEITGADKLYHPPIFRGL